MKKLSFISSFAKIFPKGIRIFCSLVILKGIAEGVQSTLTPQAGERAAVGTTGRGTARRSEPWVSPGRETVPLLRAHHRWHSYLYTEWHKGSCLVLLQRIPEELTLDALLEMNESKVKETMKRCGARDEECSRLNGALSCLRKVTESGTDCLVLWDWCPGRPANCFLY